MIFQNLHTHTWFDDGKNSPAQMAQAAVDAGLLSLGFSGHSPLPYENDWSMTADSLAAYTAAVGQVQRAFAGRLAVYQGLEWDILSPLPEPGFDYIIGSIHHLDLGSETPSVDESAALSRDILARCFQGDSDAMAEAYFAQYKALAQTPQVDIVGHFDLLCKFDEPAPLFPAQSPRFQEAALAALELLCRADKLFEVNTGAMSRGYRTSPYPSVPLLRALQAHHARLVVTSDAHTAQGIAYAFPKVEELLLSLGFSETWEYTPQGFQSRSLRP
jgi:histidinol-phosphatase (PHP family)